MEKLNVPKTFGSMVFGDKVMKERLPKETYAAVNAAIEGERSLSAKDAEAVAAVMKDWAIEKGATHFTHWFQPMTGITAEKHEGFIEPVGGEVIMKFSGKSLVRGESDASSFPSGGLRATFEARGYTAWDPTSYAFVKDCTLYIPTAFCSYGGEALDKKTPLLRSMDALNVQALRVLKALGDGDVKKVTPTVGAEQEYFLIDETVYEKRRDLIHCGRTLFGARPAKGQELEDHYYGAIKSRVFAFMKELDERLWELGVPAKTEHNEVAPAQHELAPVYATANVACDQNQLTMELMKSVAAKHGMVCLLHEKPFAGVNGSGKHVNWSLSTDTGENLFVAGKTPETNARFLLFLTAVIKAVDEYRDLLRISVASAGNDLRLGATEAPPAIISLYLGDELEGVLKAIERGEKYCVKNSELLNTGVFALPPIPKDSSDRNRTAPVAFTGNKFEFRMVGSSANISCPNFILNTAVADALKEFADVLEAAEDKNAAITELIRRTVKAHKRVIYSGNNYSDEWREEAKKRGITELKTTVDALPEYFCEKNVALFKRHGVLSESEIYSREEILLDNYASVIHIESLTAIDMLNKEIIPSVIEYQSFLLSELNVKKEFGKILPCKLEEEVLTKLAYVSDELYAGLKVLTERAAEFEKICGNLKRARFAEKELIPAAARVRKAADEAELLIGKKFRPFPDYADILYSVKH